MSLLAHRVVSAANQKPAALIAFLHGILGTKSNWSSIARRLTEAHPQWGALLVDLRKHGESQNFDPPHTLDSCAQDLLTLQKSLQVPVHAIAGHSFGGKVAIRWAVQAPELKQLWIIDSNPGLSRPTELRSEVMRV